MNIPGFTAEAAVSPARGHYRVCGTPWESTGARTVHGQAAAFAPVRQVGPGGGWWQCWYVGRCFICCSMYWCWYYCRWGAATA